ncbi:BURP domain-containing protein BNM2A-like [Euphorbia lathyris]|uniref:BURP domain-containing protein BNM2A-like n=1 Tax=Euphorbia lathyris TaxID=212925 RepID=UPI0033138A9B
MAEMGNDNVPITNPAIVNLNLHHGGKWSSFDVLRKLKASEEENSKQLADSSKNEANSIPFSCTHLPYLPHLFSFSPDSPQAKSMENTLKQCEINPIKGETKVCATCLKSTIDFVHKSFGLETQFRALQTNHIEKSGMNLENYTILSEPKEIRVPNMVDCHTLPYPYRVFYCHSQKSGNKLFMVSLGGDNGGRVEAVSVCHMDTSEWSKDHASFRVLGTQLGASHVCHFFRADVLVYVQWMKQIEKMRKGLVKIEKSTMILVFSLYLII